MCYGHGSCYGRASLSSSSFFFFLLLISLTCFHLNYQAVITSEPKILTKIIDDEVFFPLNCPVRTRVVFFGRSELSWGSPVAARGWLLLLLVIVVVVFQPGDSVT